MRVLCTGDIHIGRSSAGVPAEYGATAAQAWERIVALAINRGVRAVVLAGDVIDQVSAFYEAYGPLERGISELGSNGIATVAIAGNHDYSTLPDIARKVDALKLLGCDGTWECVTLSTDLEPDLQIVGWSFPGARWQAPQLRAMPQIEPGGFRLGVVHGTLDGAAADAYAPVAAAELAGAAAVDAWVLGHIHRPRVAPVGVPVIEMGCPQALDFGEEGARGPWLLEMTPGQPVRAVHVSFSTAAYLRVRVDVTGIDVGADLAHAVQAAIRDQVCAMEPPADGRPRHHQVRVTLTGRTRSIEELDQACADMPGPDGLSDADTVIDCVTADVTPDYDLEALARETHAAGKLARLILDLDGDGEAGPHLSPLLQRAERERSDEWRRYGDRGDLPADDTRAALRREAARLLDAALAAQARAQRTN